MFSTSGTFRGLKIFENVRLAAAASLSASAGEFFGKACILVTFGTFATLKGMTIKSLLVSWQVGQGVEKHVELAAQIAAFAFLVLLLHLTLLRLRPKETAEGWEPRISALVGTFLPSLLTALPLADVGAVFRVVAILVIISGSLLSIYVLAWLGRSFSIGAQARQLVTRGPYAVVRHPLYVSEEIAIIGLLLLFISPLAILIAAAHWLFQLRRMTNEERVLRAVFPEYPDY